MTIADAHGEMNAKIWNYNETQFAGYRTNLLVKVRGLVVAWMNSLQLKIEKIRPASESDPVSISDFVPSAPKSGEEMFAVLQDYIARISQEDIRGIVAYVVEQVKDKLLYYPAAQANHH